MFRQLYLIELLGLLIDLGLLELQQLRYLRISTGSDLLIFFTNLSLMDFLVMYLAWFCFFSLIDGFKWFWMVSHQKNIQLMMAFLQTSFLVKLFSFCTLAKLPDDVTSNIAIYADDTSLTFKCHFVLSGFSFTNIHMHIHLPPFHT